MYTVETKNDILDFETFEDAVAFIETLEAADEIEFYSGYDSFKKCWFCGEWYTKSDMDERSELCHGCYLAIRSRGEDI